ncbi:MAG: hypothetical protein AB1566_15540, partial [Chloroflexota bacterium]
MLSLILRSIFQVRSALLALGLLAVSASVLLVTAASETTVVTAGQDLTRYWRTTYDILVRPAGARSPIEEEYGLVEANYLSGIAGGITITQYEAIKAIPGVEVAAPIATLGYVFETVPINNLGLLTDRGVYRLEETLTIDDGARLYLNSRDRYYYVGPDASLPPPGPARLNYPLINPSFPIQGGFEMPFLVAGIDPPQEAALVGLDGALVRGKYLTGDKPIQSRRSADPYGTPRIELNIPILINASPYVSLTMRTELRRLSLPLEASNLEAIMARGGTKYLASLPGESLAFQEMESSAAYRRLVESLLIPDWAPGPPDFGTLQRFMISTLSRIAYQENVPPFPHNGLVLEIVPPKQRAVSLWLEEGWPAYRISAHPTSKEAMFDAAFFMEAQGVFDIERLPKPGDVNRVPLETYFPPLATLRYDEEGRPVEPRTLRPTLNPAGYIQSPPLILTTLAAAQALRGDDCISAVRVRVGGIDELTPAAQR